MKQLITRGSIFVVTTIIILYFIMPFLDAILLGAIIAYMFLPAVKMLEEYIPRSAAIFLIFIIIVIFFFVAFFSISSYISDSSFTIGQVVEDVYRYGADEVSKTLGYDFTDTDFFTGIINDLKIFIRNLALSLITVSFDVLFTLVAFMITLVYVLKDYDRISAKITKINAAIPLVGSMKLADTIGVTLDGLMRTWLTMAALKGLFTAVGFYILGVPYPLIFGLIIAFLELIPLVGHIMVWVPLGIYFFATGDTSLSAAIFLFGLIVLMLIPDYYIKPKLVKTLGKGADVHPAVLAIGFLCGIKLFALSGAIIGPVILVVSLKIINFITENSRENALSESA